MRELHHAWKSHVYCLNIHLEFFQEIIEFGLLGRAKLEFPI